MQKTDYLIVAGGTGGHVFPALAVAQELRRIGYRVSWVGANNSLEQRVALQHSISFTVNNAPVWQFKNKIARVLALFALCRSVWHGFVLLQKIKPKIVIGFGGAVTVPIGLAAFFQKRTLLIHEQNVLPGLANKVLSRVADKIMTGFATTFSNNTRSCYTGNPIRADLLALSQRTLAKKSGLTTPLKVLVLGGSLGSSGLNKIVLDAFLQLGQDFDIWHQAGLRDKGILEESYANAGKDAYVVDFIDDMSNAYAWADIVISRAGAISITEIIALGVPAILVPNPNVAANHQWYNAMHLVEHKAASCTLEDGGAATEIAGKLMYWWSNPEEYYSVSATAKGMFKDAALKQIIDICSQYYNIEPIAKS